MLAFTLVFPVIVLFGKVKSGQKSELNDICLDKNKESSYWKDFQGERVLLKVVKIRKSESFLLFQIQI